MARQTGQVAVKAVTGPAEVKEFGTFERSPEDTRFGGEPSLGTAKGGPVSRVGIREDADEVLTGDRTQPFSHEAWRPRRLDGSGPDLVKYRKATGRMRYIMVPASATTKIGDRKARPLARVVRPEHQQ